MKRYIKISLITLLSFILAISIQQNLDYSQNLHSWPEIAKNFHKEFYYTQNAIDIGENCLAYQTKEGAFPKNIYIPENITNKKIENNNDLYPTFDNNATTTEIIYLAKLYTATGEKSYKNAVNKGLKFILNSQYPNGGWAQAPLDQNINYRKHITYNDNVMTNILQLLKDVSLKNYPFEFVDDIIAQKAQSAYNKGIECILNTQIKKNGHLTVWASQYDENTLKPADARKYEPVSLNGGIESASIVLFLMSIENPSNQIIESVESAVKWFELNKIEHIKPVYFINSENKTDIKIVSCNNCPPIWARFYDIEKEVPIFSNRQSNILYNFEDIDYERRTGYKWFSYSAQKVLDEYPKWKNRIKN